MSMTAVTVTILAQTSIQDALFNYGPFGIILVLLLLGWLFPKPMIDHLLRENDRLRRDNEKVREENSELRSGIEQKIVPALTRMTDLLDKVTERGA